MKILTKSCLQCGTTITKPQNESVKAWTERHKFCSRSCRGKRIAETSVIGKPFTKERHYIPPTAYKKGQRPSPKTEFKKGHQKTPEWHKAMIGRTPWNKGKRHPAVTGPKNSNWKGGISSLNNRVRHCPEMNSWRNQVFQRDGYTCVLCGRKRKVGDRVVLNADHYPKLYCLIIEENNITTFEQALACGELWDIKNGRTLCVECHLPTKGVNQHTRKIK